MRRARQEYREALGAQERIALSLQESEERLRLAKDAARMGSWHWNILTGELVWSDRCKALFALSPDTVMSYDVFLTAIHPADRERNDRAVRDALAHNTDYDVEMRVPWPDGSVHWVAAKGKAFYGADGRAVRMAGMALDITNQKRLEEALQEADRRKNEFLAVLSHELRNPLAPIRNSVQVLDHTDPASEQARRARIIIARQVDHLTRLVEDLLDVKRISTGKLRLQRNRMDLVEEVRASVEDMRPLFVSRGIELDFHMPSTPVWVNGDHTRLAQVVNNLLHNASKFTNRGGHAAVVIESRDGQVHLRVRDDGAGLALDMQDRLFEAFVQGEKTLHRSKSGLGLGLSLVRGIAELHGGTAVARSDGVGKGTEFVVTLPTTDAGVTAGADAALPEAGSRHRVLIIEDNEDAAQSLRDVLELLGGHEVRVAHDGPAALQLAATSRPDLVFLDIGMPDMDGYEVARRLRKTPGLENVVLAALTGWGQQEDRRRTAEAGFDHHLVKPPEPKALESLLSDLARKEE